MKTFTGVTMRVKSPSVHNERGSLLILALFVIFVSSMASVGIVGYIQHGIRIEKANASFTQAHYIAQGALNLAVGELSRDGNLLALRAQEQPVSGTLGNGAYTLVYTALTGGVTRVDSAGASNGATTILRLYARPEGGIEGIFAKSMMSERTIELRHSSAVHNFGDVHSNADVTAYDTVYISGDMTAVGTADPTTATVDGTITSGVPYEDYPQIDYDYYYKIAEANGQILTGDQKFNAAMSPINPPGGILFVDGDVTIGDNVVINGSIVATGDITRVSNPALVVSAGGVDLFAENNLDIPADIAFLSSGHTNANLSITGDTTGSAGTITYVGTATVSSGSSVDTLQTGPEPMPASPLTFAELKTLAEDNGSYFVGNIELKESIYGVEEAGTGRIVNNGSVIYATGGILVSGNDFRRDVTLVSETSDVIVTSTMSVTMLPGQNAGGILIYARNSIDLRGNTVEVGGVLLAETGNFYFKGDENGRAAEGSFWCGGRMTISGDRVDLGNIGDADPGDGSSADTTSYINALKQADGTVAPALVSIGGNITMVDAVDVTGLIYTGRGTFSSTANASKAYRGAIYSWGDLLFSGDSQLTYDESYVQIGQGLIYEPPTILKLAMER